MIGFGLQNLGDDLGLTILAVNETEGSPLKRIFRVNISCPVLYIPLTIPSF
jgi:hypothetical protein